MAVDRQVAGDIGDGLRGDVGRTGSSCSSCSTCGVRNDVGARFCDACGSPLAGS